MKLSLSYFSLLLFSVFAVSACSKDKGEDNKIEFDSEAEAHASFEATSVTCGEPGKKCPDSVAGLALLFHTPNAEKTWQSSACSATLLEGNRILTNDHCIPAELLKEGKSCDKRVKILFPQTATQPYETFYCDKIYKVQKQRTAEVQRPDWVILEFKGQTKRKPSPVNIDSTPSGLKLTSYPVYYQKDNETLKGLIQKNTCTTNMKHWFSAFYFHPQASIVALANCSRKVIKGNSGVGFFNSNNELKVVGSFAPTSDPGSDNQTLTLYGKHFIINSKMMGGTNLSCIKEFNPSPSDFCYYGGGSNFFQLLTQSMITYDLEDPKNSKILSTLEKYNTENSPIKWKNSDSSSPFYHLVFKILQHMYNKPAETTHLTVSNIPETIVDDVSKKLTSTHFPLTPECIQDNGPNTFHSDLPTYKNDAPNLQINSSGIVHHSFQHDPLRLRFVRSGNHYKVEVERITEQLREELLAMSFQMEFSLIQCQTLNISDQELIQEFGNPCEAYNEHKNKIQEWMEENSITPQLRRNELFMQEVGADTLDWEIPICS